MREKIRLKIADTVFSFSAVWGSKRFLLEDNYLPFKTDKRPDIVLKLKKRPPDIQYAKEIFITPIWSCYYLGKRQAFLFFSSAKGKHRHPERTLVMKSDFKKADVVVSEFRNKEPALRNPFAYPLDQILMISLLPRRQGLLVHSCGFSYKKRGYLFIGSSGACK